MFADLEFGWETPKQVTHGSKSIDFPLCINNLHPPMPIIKKLKMNLRNGGLFL